MDKYTAQFKHPCPVHSAAPHAAVWASATPETHPHYFGEKKIAISGGRVFVKAPVHQAGLNGRTKGGKWVEVKPLSMHKRLGIIEEFAARFLDGQKDLKPATFRGGPRVN